MPVMLSTVKSPKIVCCLRDGCGAAGAAVPGRAPNNLRQITGRAVAPTKGVKVKPMWTKVTLAIIVLIGLLLLALMLLGVGGALPGWILLFYIPFVFVGAGVLKWASLGFK